MAHCNTILSQILKLVPRHEFETLAKQHHSGRSFRTASRWSQFVVLMMAQMTGRNSLRDIVENISAQAHRLYHLVTGIGPGQQVKLISPSDGKTHELTVSGLFRSGMYEYDAHLVGVTLARAQRLYGLDGVVSGLGMKLDRLERSNAVKETVQNLLGTRHPDD